MAESKAALLAKGWKSQKTQHDPAALKSLPANVQEAILDVERHSLDLGERIALAEELYQDFPSHELALAPGHRQTSWAQRFELVDGEIVEVVKESHDSPVRLVHRPDLKAGPVADPASALEARLRDAAPSE